MTAHDRPASTPPQLLSPSLVRGLGIGLVIAAVAYAALLLYADAPLLVGSIEALSGSTLALGAVLASANFVVRLLRWEYYLARVSIRVPFYARTLVFFAGFAMSITPGKVGEALKSLMLRDGFDVALARSSPIPVAERLTDLIGMLLIAAVASLTLPGGIWLAGICFLGVLMIGIGLFWQGAREWLIDRLTSFGKLRRFRHKIIEAHEALSGIVTPAPLAVGTLLSVVAWSLHGLCLAAVASGFQGVGLTIGESFIAYSAPLLAGAVALIPGGLGLTEASMVGVIQHLGGPGATAPVATAITMIVRLMTFWFAIGLGLLALIAWRRARFHP